MTIDISLDAREFDELISHNTDTAEYIVIVLSGMTSAQIIDRVTKVAKELKNLLGVSFMKRFSPVNNDPPVRLPVAALNQLFSLRRNTLVQVRMEGLTVVGLRREFNDAYQSLSQMRKVRNVLLDSVRLGAGEIDFFIEALLGIQTLQEVQFHEMNPSIAPGAALDRLCKHSENVSAPLSLYLSEMQLSDPFLQSILGRHSRLAQFYLLDMHNIQANLDMLVRCLRTNTHLKELQLGNSDEDEDKHLIFQSGVEVLRALQSQPSTLEILKLDIRCGEADCQYSALMDALENSRSLKEVHLDIADPNSARRRAGVSSLLRRFADNKSHIKAFRLNIGQMMTWSDANSGAHRKEILDDYSNEFNSCLQTALKRNVYLTEVALTGMDFWAIQLSEEVQFWLKLNNAGRRDLQCDLENRKRWSDSLIEHKDDPMVTFHFLSMNPTILCSKVSKKASKKRKRTNI